MEIIASFTAVRRDAGRVAAGTRRRRPATLQRLICASVFTICALPPAGAVEPEKQPIFANIVNGLLCGTSSTNQCKVPPGQRLIIEYASGYVFAPASARGETSVTMAVTDPALGLNGAGFHVFPAIKVNTASTTDVFAFSVPLKMMLHPNATFYFSNVAGLAVSGYLVAFTGN